jgi:hypothetical protein
MKLSTDQVRKYVEARFSGQRVGYRKELSLRCPFHDDKTASLSFNVEKGVWKCHAGCGEGGMLDFEQKLNGGTLVEAGNRIEELLALDHLFESQRFKPSKIYPYVDARGKLLFEKLRFPHIDPRHGMCPCGQPQEPQCSARKKHFGQRQPNAKGSYDYNLTGIEKPLYRLPEVLQANTIIVVEGEKDADRIASLNLTALDPAHTTVAATCNFDGAGKTTSKWKDSYSAYFLGKRVIIFPDNDPQGIAHAERVAESASKYACGVRIVPLPGVPEHGDVSDWLDRGHTIQELMELIAKAHNWRPKEEADGSDVELTKFAVSASPETDWLVEGVIQRGANGIITGFPKAAKSMVALDLVMALATGTPWLGFKIPRRVKCELFSREDGPPMTKQRIGAFYRGTSRPDLENWSWVNTREQTPTFSLENAEDVAWAIRKLKSHAVEFAVFDVFRRIHSKDENDNTEIQEVLDALTRIQQEAGCAIALVHHLTKDPVGSLFRHIRGASAIDGWTEWAMAITVTNPEEENQKQWVRKVDFETKAACAQDPAYFQIESTPDTLRLVTMIAVEGESRVR